MAQDQGTYPGLCLLTDSDGKVITIEDSVSHDTVVFTHTNTGEGEFAICYPEVLGSGVPEAALADFGTHNVENTATQGYAFTLGDEEYLVRQNVIAPTPGEINDVLYSRSLVVDSRTMDVLVTEGGSVVSYFNGELDVCFVKFAGGEWHAETAYYDQIVEASGAADSVSIGCTVADGVYTIKYGFNTYVMTEDSLTPSVTEFAPIAVQGVVQVFNNYNCTKYFDGTTAECYVRINENIGLNGQRGWGSMSEPSSYLNIETPTTENPDDYYQVSAYIDYISQALRSPIVAGSILACRTQQSPIGTAVQTIFE